MLFSHPTSLHSITVAAAKKMTKKAAIPAKLIEFEIIVDGSLMEDFRADGMIVATSTGSTTYAMSARGAIVDPRVDAIVLVPMSPFKLSSRPWVIAGHSVIEVRLKLPGKEALVVGGRADLEYHILRGSDYNQQGQDAGQVCEGGKGTDFMHGFYAKAKASR